MLEIDISRKIDPSSGTQKSKQLVGRDELDDAREQKALEASDPALDLSARVAHVATDL